MRLIIKPIVAALALIALAPAVARSQGRVELTPYLGMYLPTADMIKEVDQASGLTLTFKQASALSLGIRVGYRLSDRTTLEGAFGYTPSDVSVEITGFGSASRGGTVMTLSGRVVQRMSAATARTTWHLIGGITMISRGGSIWSDLESSGLKVGGRTDFGAVLGGGANFPVSKGILLRVDLEDYLSQAKFTFDDGTGQTLDTKSKFQNDLVISLGLAFPLGKKK